MITISGWEPQGTAEEGPTESLSTLPFPSLGTGRKNYTAYQMNKFRKTTARKGKDLTGYFCFPFYHKPPQAESTESLPVWGDSPSPHLISQGSSDSQWGGMNTCSISKNWKQPRCLPTDGWINKIWYLHKVWAKYSSMERNGVLICAVMWKHLERLC